MHKQRSRIAGVQGRRARASVAVAMAMSLASPCLAIIMPSCAYAVTNGDDIVLGGTVSAWGDATDAPDVSAPSAIMVDADGNTLFERNADAQRPIASVTKVMTVYLAVTRCADSLDDQVTVGTDSASVGGSTSGLRAGDTLTLRSLLLCAMLPSGNDAADAIARYVGARIDPASSDPYATFVQAMNDTAQSLGMGGTVYRNPHGLDVDQYAGDQHSTARDVSKLVVAAMGNDTFRWGVPAVRERGRHAQRAADAAAAQEHRLAPRQLQRRDRREDRHDAGCRLLLRRRDERWNQGGVHGRPR